MLDALQRAATGTNVLCALTVFLLALLAMNMAATKFYETNGGYGLLDLGGGANLLRDGGSFTPAQAYAIISRYGASGITHYYALLIADIFFPLSLGLFALLSKAWALGRIEPQRPRRYLLLLVPLAYTLCDWMENLGILTLLLNYPVQLPHVAVATNHLRACKNLFATAAIVLVVTAWAVVLRQQQRRRKR